MIEFLRTVRQFAQMDDVELQAIAEAMTTLEYEPGELIISEGSDNSSVHIIREGGVRVLREVDEKEVPLCDLGKGQTFGELSILGDGTTTATLKAIRKTTIHSLSMKDLDFVLEQSPGAAAKFWLAIARDLRDRLVETNEVVRDYFEVNQAIVENPTFREAYAMCNL